MSFNLIERIKKLLNDIKKKIFIDYFAIFDISEKDFFQRLILLQKYKFQTYSYYYIHKGISLNVISVWCR